MSSIDPASLPPHIRAAVERRPVFAPFSKAPIPAPAEPVATPAQERWQSGEEKALSALVVADLRRRGYFVIVSRTDKPTSQQKGIPDIIACHGGHVAMVELKAGNGKLSTAQRDCHAELTAAGVPVATCWTFDSAVNFVTSNIP